MVLPAGCTKLNTGWQDEEYDADGQDRDFAPEAPLPPAELNVVFLTIALETRHMKATRALATRTSARLRTLDALHLVMASEVEATVATFDERLHETARLIGLPVLTQTL